MYSYSGKQAIKLLQMNESLSSNVFTTKVNDCLIVTFGEDLSSVGLEEVKNVVLRDIREKSCSSIIFELSALKYMDTYEFAGLKEVSEMGIILGAKTIFAGLPPGIVFHLIVNNVETAGITAVLDLNEALEVLGIVNDTSRN
jgi:anti-anti-sigma regulatory factor